MKWKRKNICRYVGFFQYTHIFLTLLFSNQFHHNCLNTVFFYIGSKVKGLTGLSNILIPFSWTAISFIDNLSSFISISNSYITHINWWVCMNPQGQYFIFAPFAQSLNFSENGRLCRCKCVLFVLHEGVISRQIIIRFWLDLDQRHSLCITCRIGLHSLTAKYLNGFSSIKLSIP